MKRLAPTTWVWLALAVASTALLWADPWRDEGPQARYVSSRSAAQRLFPELQDRRPRGAEIVLRPSEGATVALRPAGDGHIVEVDDVVLGPADPDALEGLWDSLRLATTLRAVPDDANIDDTGFGSITVIQDGRPLRLELGTATAEGAGVYGRIVAGERSQSWVVEQELARLLEAEPLAWLARRLVVTQASAITRVAWPTRERVLERGADGLWRQRDPAALLNSDAVDARLEHLVSAQLEPILEPERAPARADAEPWLRLELEGGRRETLAIGSDCPGRPRRVVVWRGRGWPGCIDVALLEPWPLPGAERQTDSAAIDGAIDGAGGGDAQAVWVEPRLLPYELPRVLSVEQTQPESQVLRRAFGDFELEDGLEDRGTGSVTAVERAAVERWYEPLQAAEVEMLEDAALAWQPDVVLTLTTDFAVTMTLSCDRKAAALYCRRDDGPILRVLDRAVEPELAPEALVSRSSFAVALGEARALEILPGPDGQTARQSAHLDLGVWRLDAPMHPDGDAALDEIVLEELLAALASPQIRKRVEVPETSPERSLIVEQTPRRGRDTRVRIALHPGCIAVHHGQAVELAESTCAALTRDLLFSDSLGKWLARARTLELGLADERIRLRRGPDDGWLTGDEAAAARAEAVIERLEAVEFAGVRRGRPTGEAELSLRILPLRGAPFDVALGSRWLHIVGRDWHYVLDAPR